VQNFTFGSPSLVNYNMYAVSSRDEGEFGVRKDISKMYFNHWEPPGVSKRRRSVNFEASISGENQTLGGHSGRPSE